MASIESLQFGANRAGCARPGGAPEGFATGNDAGAYNLGSVGLLLRSAAGIHCAVKIRQYEDSLNRAGDPVTVLAIGGTATGSDPGAESREGSASTLWLAVNRGTWRRAAGIGRNRRRYRTT